MNKRDASCDLSCGKCAKEADWGVSKYDSECVCAFQGQKKACQLYRKLASEGVGGTRGDLAYRKSESWRKTRPDSKGSDP